MTRLEDAFDDLIAQHPTGDPDEVLARARAEARADRSHRRTRSVLAAAAVVLVFAALTATVIASRDDPTDRVQAGEGHPDEEGPDPQTRPLQVFFTADAGGQDGCARTEAVERPPGPRSAVGGAAADALTALLDGPTAAETERGLSSPFAGAGGTLGAIELSAGTATIDFDPEVKEHTTGASTACGSAAILSELQATVSAYLNYDHVIFTIGGDATAFFTWLGIDRPLEGPLAPSTTTTTEPATPGDTGYAVASVLGVTLRIGSSLTAGVGLTRDPAASAYAVGTDLVVFQNTDADVDTITPPVPAPATGAIRVWARNNGIHDLPIPADARRAILLDTATVDGAPTALVAVRRGDDPSTDGSPVDATVTLVAIDLATEEARDIADVPLWEQGQPRGRLLPDGDAIYLTFKRTWGSVTRWRAGSTKPLWSAATSPDLFQTVPIRGTHAAIIDNLAPSPGEITIRTLDLETGAVGEPTRMSVATDAVWCSDWYDSDDLSCARRGGSAGAINERTGAWRGLSTPTGAVVTASR